MVRENSGRSMLSFGTLPVNTDTKQETSSISTQHIITVELGDVS